MELSFENPVQFVNQRTQIVIQLLRLNDCLQIEFERMANQKEMDTHTAGSRLRSAGSISFWRPTNILQQR